MDEQSLTESPDPPGALPQHARIAADLRTRIRSGELPPGASVSSEAELAERFAVSRGTVRQALAALRSEGLIDGGRGRRPVVSRPLLAQSFDALISFSAWAESIGREPGAQLLSLSVGAAQAEEAGELDLATGTEIYEYRRLRLLDGEPAMLEASSFIPEVGRLLSRCDLSQGSVYAQLAALGVSFHEAQHRIAAVAADAEQAELLGVRRRTPLLQVHRRVLDPDGRALEIARDTYRGDAFAITIHNRAAQVRAGVGLSLE